ncbi:MAG: LAGLIDADG family homing endonuclease [Promethearchaeota archaeon]
MRKEIYTTLNFIKDLLKRIDSLLGRHISQEDLSVQILNQHKSHITRKLVYSKDNPQYLLTKELVSNWINALKVNNCYSSKIEEVINKYSRYNDLPSNRNYIFKKNPNLQLKYFEIISSKEKAYWLGWLFAEGNIYKKKDGQLVVSVQIDVKDGILIKRFIEDIGFNPKRVEYYKRTKYNKNREPYYSRIYRVRIKNRLFAEKLMIHGFPVGKKADKLRFPKLNNKEFDLAFLLGFYDGDGSIQHNKCGKITEISIFSNSKLFIEDIKSKFKLDYLIREKRQCKKDGNLSITYDLSLGFTLYNNIIVNFDKSLPRKRDFVSVSQIERQLSGKYGRKRFKFSKEELKDLLPKYTLQEIANIHKNQYGIKIHHTTVIYWRNKWF